MLAPTWAFAPRIDVGSTTEVIMQAAPMWALAVATALVWVGRS